MTIVIYRKIAMGRHRANERSLGGSPAKIEARAGRPIHGPIEATSANAVRAARWLLRRDSRVVGGAIARSGPAFWNCVAAANCARSDQKATSGPDVAAVPIFSGAFT